MEGWLAGWLALSLSEGRRRLGGVGLGGMVFLAGAGSRGRQCDDGCVDGVINNPGYWF
jgi:hypothetical protein